MSTNDPSWPGSDGPDDGPEPSTPPPPASSAPPPPPPTTPSPPPPAPAPAPAATGGATLGVRFGARVIDGIIVGIANAILLFAINSVLVSGIIGAAIGLGYFAYLESERGATFGKQLLNLKVESVNGGNPSLEESLKRNGWLAFQIVPVIGGLAGLAAAIAIAVTINSSNDGRGWHDEFAGTRVLRTS